MRKSLLLALLLLSFIPTGLRAQNSLFDLETDTVCVGQEVHITPSVMNGSSYYWGFCSGYLPNAPLIDNLGGGFGLNGPFSIELGKDGDNYYGFVVNGTSTELIRLNYGKSLANSPTVTNFGNLDLSVSPSPNSLYLTKDSGKWYLFMCTGGGTEPSTVSRFDFGSSLANVPNGVLMGNPDGLLNDPRGIFVAKEGSIYYGFVVNAGNNRLIRLNFGNNISRTPTATALTPSGGSMFSALNGPRDIAPIYDQGAWYFFVPNLNSDAISRLYFGNTLSNTPALSLASPLGGGGGGGNRLDQPSAISLVKDCGSFQAYITNRGDDRLLRYSVPSLTQTWVYNQQYSPGFAFDGPADITRIVRDRDSLFAFVVNNNNSTLTRLIFPQCQNASIQSSSAAQPPAFTYNTAGTYNIFLALNEGQPNMDIGCKQIRVLDIPPLTLTNDTLICAGDTLRVAVAAQYALNYLFSPAYNISDTAGINIYVYPELPTTYNVRIPFINGCIVDTSFRVDISSVRADAGPDRTLYDGASTIIGGPNTLMGPRFTYQWFPTQYLDNPFSLTPTVNPPVDIAYYLSVTNTDGCTDIDTVKVRVSCADLNLPNAFAPDNSRGAPTRFGLLNKQIVQLNYFRIFDRWGRQVFETADLTKQWDGNVSGNPAPFGVYVWEADGFCSSGERISRSGNVTLIR